MTTKAKKNTLIRKFAKNEDGVTAIEYCLIASLVGIGMMVGASSMGDANENRYECLAKTVQSASSIKGCFGSSGDGGTKPNTGGVKPTTGGPRPNTGGTKPALSVKPRPGIKTAGKGTRSKPTKPSLSSSASKPMKALPAKTSSRPSNNGEKPAMKASQRKANAAPQKQAAKPAAQKSLARKQ